MAQPPFTTATSTNIKRRKNQINIFAFVIVCDGVIFMIFFTNGYMCICEFSKRLKLRNGCTKVYVCCCCLFMLFVMLIGSFLLLLLLFTSSTKIPFIFQILAPFRLTIFFHFAITLFFALFLIFISFICHVLFLYIFLTLFLSSACSFFCLCVWWFCFYSGYLVRSTVKYA